MKVFIDTNVWIDLVSERQPFFSRAVVMLSKVVDSEWLLGISSVSLVTAHYICHNRFKMPVEEIKNKIFQLSENMEICPVVGKDIVNSYICAWKDFEDAVQYNAAKRWGADCIVTRNPKDFVQSGISIYTPDEFIAVTR